MAGLPFFQGALLGFSAAASPGPFQAFALAQGLRHGVARCLPIALAPLASDGPIVALSLAVLTRAPAGLLRGLEVAGGLFLLFLSAGAIRALGAPRGGAVPPAARSPARAFGQAVVMNALSPGPWIFWTAVSGPILVELWRDGPARAAAFLAGFYLLLCGGNAAVLSLGASARSLGPRAQRGLAFASAAVLAGFGVLQIWRGATGG